MHVDGIFLDDGAGPHARHQVVLGHQRARRADQDLDDLERAAADGNGDPMGTQFARHGIDLPSAGAEDVQFRLGHAGSCSGMSRTMVRQPLVARRRAPFFSLPP